ncbi:glycosyltransferase family 2 protein [Reichenbachiella versicolor]|uniref:glycosyltransferase family 2 protein n=1 Tax=Reichenbachiella versicolor TaxID=1821036 RepID=UPI000D6DE993|nr:glycosyltransferase family 2 protein [Reichenbachiella versicolor]
MLKLSVVIPVYNVSKYLRKCVDSVLEQTLRDIEVILINDASPDPKDHEICEDYIKTDDRVVYYKHDVNKGLGGARNTGIELAKADYIAFVDSDDWIESQMFKVMHERAISKGADIVQCYFMEHFQDSGKTKLRRVKKFRRQADIMNCINVLAWNKIYKKTLFTDYNVFYPERLVSEDIATTTRLLYGVKNVELVRKPFYNYRVNRHGAITNNYSNLFSDLPQVFEIIQNHLIPLNRLESDRLFFEKRVVKSLLHYLKRLKQDDRISTRDKNQIILNSFNKNIKYLSGSENFETMYEALKYTENKSRKINFQVLIKNILYLFGLVS